MIASNWTLYHILAGGKLLSQRKTLNARKRFSSRIMKF